MAKSRKSVVSLIAELEAAGKLTSSEAHELRVAPKWAIPFSDVASYLGGSVIFVGLVWIVVALMQDVSQIGIDTALFIASFATAFLSFKLMKKGGRLNTLGESIAAVSTMTFAFAIGLLLDILNVNEDLILLIVSTMALAIGIGLSSRTTFIGTIITVATTQPFMVAVITTCIPDTPITPLLFVGSGSVLIWFSLRNIGLRFIARAAGAVSIVIASIGYSTWDSNNWQPIVGFAIVGLLFIFGAKRMHLEIVAVGGLGITIITGVLAGQLFDSPLLQGLSVIGVGAIIVFTSIAISKKGDAVI
jgi:hypothetical protein